ncbi:hypothetical protein QSV34_12705 [Porticoccus sp. W117]|uniref:hypothetical protein n=1 Tax=Porticoccus sp. W117 TaxID=3054777 RepID=UPI0025929F06|nr:hypothetical protein [Porticoccus sp. W117]MDM3872207.1 hypothetical protein [Porticoccus sp. W117]
MISSISNYRYRYTAILILCLLAVKAQPIVADSHPSIEDYGMLPSFRSLTLSPDGEHLAYIRRQGKQEFLVVFDRKAKKMVAGINVTANKARSAEFISKEHLIN